MYRKYPAFDASKCHLSYENSLVYGYNHGIFNYRQSSSDSFYTAYSAIGRPVMSFRDECIDTAKRIRESTSDKLYVFLSGGLDSEITALSFIAAGIPFEGAILRFNDHLNTHDIRYALDFVEALNVKHSVIDINLDRFFERDAYDFADRTYCISPILLPTMWLMDQVDGYVITGAGTHGIAKNIKLDPSNLTRTERSLLLFDPKPEGHTYDGLWYNVDTERFWAWQRHFMIQNRSACPMFFKHTPEICASVLLDPMIEDLINDRTSEISNINIKFQFYKKHFPTIIDRPKYHGFEKIWHSIDVPCRKRLVELYPGSNAFPGSTCADLMRNIGLID